MSITIESNIASLNAQRRLGESTAGVQQSYQRLSSGLRINRSKDDAAGLAIAESLKVDTRVFTQGVKNLNDGLSLLSIGDSAVEQMTNIVVRLRELAEQSANGVYGPSQRKALDIEAQALSKEYSRIIHTTQFNGAQLFDGQLGQLRVQAGYGSNGAIISGLGGAVGSGSFLAGVSSGTGGLIKSGDFNNDGIQDLVTGGGSLSYILLGNGDGTFKVGTSLAATDSDNPTSLSVGDVNGDGILDVVSTGYYYYTNFTSIFTSRATMTVFQGNGDGTFHKTATFFTDNSQNKGGAQLGDFNGDGRDDIVYDDGSERDVYLSNGNGTFAAPISVAGGGRAMTVGDLNGDGKLDFIIGNYFPGGNTFTVELGNGNGTFQDPKNYDADASAFASTLSTLADVNGDGILDVLSLNATNSGGGQTSVSVNIGNGNGTFRVGTSVSLGSWSTLKTADLNGDGAQDLILGNGSALSISLGNGNGTFRAPTSAGTGNNAAFVDSAAVDVNGDGVQDLIGGGAGLSVSLANALQGAAPLLSFDLSTKAGARQALPVFTQKIAQLGRQRGSIGAFESRISTAINTQQVNIENDTAAASRIEDVDVAEESAQLVRQNILQQADAAVLAQANLQPNLALQLLGH